MTAEQPLLGKVAFVTGGARRIGRAIALELAWAGADLAITYRKSPTEALETVEKIEAMGRRAAALECDVRSELSVRAAISSAAHGFGRLDTVVNNAGLFETAPLEQLSVDQWDAVFETNVRGPFLVAREALPHLKANRGRIINLGSLGGIRPWAGHAHYCASKSALHMLTMTMAKAWGPEVAVNCVAPGWIEMAEEEGAVSERFASKTPLNRNGKARDVAQAVLYFAASASFITGQILTVDGGLGL
jgi:3-oxoacyl-[acyl-carrier protein] reductase/pteridine reductase